MSNSTNGQHHGGVGFLGLLTILFIALKLTGHIAWSWVWVLAPIWMGAIGAVLLFLVGFYAMRLLKDS